MLVLSVNRVDSLWPYNDSGGWMANQSSEVRRS